MQPAATKNTNSISADEDSAGSKLLLLLDTFTFLLPGINITGKYVALESVEGEQFASIMGRTNDTLLEWRPGAYYSIVALIGKVEHSLTVNLLNQVLFAERQFRSELAFLIDRISSERPRNVSGSVEVFDVDPILFNLEVEMV
jgi:hypothetical protein